MSERLEATEPDEETVWQTGEHYSRLNVQAGKIGDSYYFHMPAFTLLVKTPEDIEDVNAEFSVLISKYIDQIIVGEPNEASLILSINQAAADLALQNEIIKTLREKIYELTGSYADAGDWEENQG